MGKGRGTSEIASAIEDYRSEKGLARVAQSLAGWTEKWFPDAYVVALALALVLVLVWLLGMTFDFVPPVPPPAP